jgi:hypothetical protein
MERIAVGSQHAAGRRCHLKSSPTVVSAYFVVGVRGRSTTLICDESSLTEQR